MSEPDIEKGKKKKRRRSARVYINANRPLAVPLDEIAAHFPADDEDQDPAEKGTTMGNPHQPLGRSVTDRLSPSRVTGGAARSTGDHNADPMNQAGPRQMAFGHDDMRQGTTNPVPLLSLRTDADAFPRDLRGSAGVPIALARIDAAAAAGMPSFRADPTGSPVRPMDHQSRGSGTPSNGTHRLDNPTSAPVHAMKARSPLEIMKDTQRRMGGR